MKTNILMAALVLSGVTAFASATEKSIITTAVGINPAFLNAEPVVFVERGVEFFIFPNGEFDFNTRPTVRPNGRRGSVNATFGAPGVRVRYSNMNYGVRVEHDNFGRVRRIGNVFINYDQFGRIKRAGSVYMTYNRGNGTLTQVGGLRVRYNRWGRLVHTQGAVNNNWYAYNRLDGPNHFDNDNFDDDFDDDDMYYYRSNKKTNSEID